MHLHASFIASDTDPSENSTTGMPATIAFVMAGCCDHPAVLLVDIVLVDTDSRSNLKMIGHIQ
ncbi:MAG: hypothetical protein U9N07_05905 [Euryarchaeota archaeon]|nr:hypothetical protein [Euryarchaeota archaeon]